jgi:hypothetical protein
VSYEALANERLSRKMLIQALLLRNLPFLRAYSSYWMYPRETGSTETEQTKVIPFLENRPAD